MNYVTCSRKHGSSYLSIYMLWKWWIRHETYFEMLYHIQHFHVGSSEIFHLKHYLVVVCQCICMLNHHSNKNLRAKELSRSEFCIIYRNWESGSMFLFFCKPLFDVAADKSSFHIWYKMTALSLMQIPDGVDMIS